MLDIFLDMLTYIFSALTLGLTGLMLLSYRKPKKFKLSSIFSSVALTTVTLIVFLLISGAKVNGWIAAGLLFLGGMWGVVRGMMIKLYQAEGTVMIRNSILAYAGWGGSLALSSLFNSFDSAVLAALGLIPLFFSTGTQIMIKLTVLARRMFMQI
jgi:hypothetical protein